jgi:hypothetical protein
MKHIKVGTTYISEALFDLSKDDFISSLSTIFGNSEDKKEEFIALYDSFHDKEKEDALEDKKEVESKEYENTTFDENDSTLTKVDSISTKEEPRKKKKTKK